MRVNSLAKREKATHLREERDEALYKAYNAAVSEFDFASQDDAYNWVRKHSAPRFYITPDFCAIVLGRMISGRHPEVYGTERLRKFNYLFERYKQIKSNPKTSDLTIIRICEIIVHEKAPEFYLSLSSTAKIISRQRRLQCKRFMDRWVR